MKPDMYQAGAPIKIGWLGYWHYAIVSDQRHCGKPMLISLSFRTGTVAEEPWDDVARGHRVMPSELRSDLTSEEIVQTARSKIGQERYNLVTSNCEHFVRDVLGLPPQSRQLQMAMGAGVSTLLLTLRLARGHPIVAIAATVVGIMFSSRFSAR